MKPTGKSSVSGDRKTTDDAVSFFAITKPNGKAVISSATAKPDGGSTVSSVAVEKPNGKTAVSPSNPVNPNAAAALSDAHGDQVMLLRDVSLGPREAELMFRLIHFWEARNPITKTLIGQEMLLIDEEGTVIQGFVPAGRVGTFDLISGSVFKLQNFFGSKNKNQYRVADHIAIVSFSWNSVLTVIDNPPVQIPEDRFKFHGYDDFRANCDSKGDLYDFVGHMRLVNGQTISSHAVLDEVDIAEKRHLSVHVQIHDGPVMKLYLWDNAAFEFCLKFKSYDSAPSVFLVTTLNPKHVGGTFCLTSMSSSRVFMDTDVQPTRDYLEWLSSNTDVANRIAADVVTKPEAVTLEELFSYIKQAGSKVAWFECTATIDDVIRDSAWYYISCGDCNTKAVKGPSSLICHNKKCVNNEVMGVAQYLTRISVYDKSEQTVFVILGDAGKQLTGKDASELVANYFKSNEGVRADQLVPVPQALLDAIGQTRKFIVKVSDHNLQGKFRTITVTKILPSEALLPGKPDGIPKTGGEDFGPSRDFVNSAGDKARKAFESPESAGAKRSKSG
ncbi:hypothetical protein Bca4012_036901 [Brassica carinata]